MSDSVVVNSYLETKLPTIIIDSEFEEWLLPLSSDEFERLEESVLSDGCRDSLTVWNNILLDGHHRYKICKKHNLPFNTAESFLQTREEAKNWIINNQLGRRNVIPEQRNYLIGKIYREMKNEHGGDRKSEESSCTNYNLKTDEAIAEKFNVSPRTVHNAEKFADALDTLAEELGEEVKQDILSGEIKISQKSVIDNAALFTSDKEEWNTPPEIIESVLQVFDGTIDVDPCSNSIETPNIPAKVLYTKADDGLSKDWAGKAYINPPYGDVLLQWIEKIVSEYLEGGMTEALVLVPNRSDTRWYRLINDYPFCQINGRLKFSGSKNSATFPSVVFYLGENVKGFYESFIKHGAIFRKIAWEEADVS